MWSGRLFSSSAIPSRSPSDLRRGIAHPGCRCCCAKLDAPRAPSARPRGASQARLVRAADGGLNDRALVWVIRRHRSRTSSSPAPTLASPPISTVVIPKGSFRSRTPRIQGSPRRRNRSLRAMAERQQALRPRCSRIRQLQSLSSFIGVDRTTSREQRFRFLLII